MTLRQLEVFLAVAREKSFSRAAKRIHSSQPTLSEHIGELEGELGKKLFFRRGREVTMTEAGRVFEQYAAGAVSAVEGARQALADLDGLAHGSLLIGASTTPGLYVMPRIVAAFRAKYPGVELKLQIANSQINEGVMAGLGVAFVSIYAVRGEVATGRLRALRLRGIQVQRHFHVIHHEARRVTASARAFMELLEEAARRPEMAEALKRKPSRALH